MTNRRSGVKLFLSVITAPIVLAHLIIFLNRRCHVNSPRLAYSKYKHVRANTFGIVNVHIWITQSRWETEPVFLNVYRAQELIPRNEFRQPCRLAGRYDNPIPPRFLAHIDSLKIPAQRSRPLGQNSQRFAYSSRQCLFIKL